MVVLVALNVLSFRDVGASEAQGGKRSATGRGAREAFVLILGSIGSIQGTCGTNLTLKGHAEERLQLRCYKGVKGYYEGVTRALQGCYKGVGATKLL
jgi:hypothetical protein